mmetsp:Transcript_71909/g.161394  ORF Transcript_71909/g.161394 Transcript_71909/m.161394 type:complete len:416 (+) Transcript_71909:3-1250(+)
MGAPRAAEASKRATAGPRSSTPSNQEVQLDSGVAGKSKLQLGFQALLEFRSFTSRRFGNPVRTWFMLDPEANMRLGEQQFARKCVEIGFRGNIMALWQYIDSDQTGTVSLLELDSSSAVMLAGFKLLLQEKFNNRSIEAFHFIDERRSGRVDRPTFVAGLKCAGYHGAISRLFDLLDRQGLGIISASDLKFLDTWKLPAYIFEKPDMEGLQAVKARLLEVHSNLLRAWRKGLDRDGTMRVAWDEFRTACLELARATPPKAASPKTASASVPSSPASGGAQGALPRTEKEIAAVWRALDDDCSGWISLREFDRKSFEAVAAFKRWADRVHGGVVKAFRFLDNSGAPTGSGSNLKLSEGELRRAVRGKDGCKANMELLFEGLDANNTYSLTEADVKFLDGWDLAWEEWEAAAKNAGG